MSRTLKLNNYTDRRVCVCMHVCSRAEYVSAVSRGGEEVDISGGSCQGGGQQSGRGIIRVYIQH